MDAPHKCVRHRRSRTRDDNRLPDVASQVRSGGNSSGSITTELAPSQLRGRQRDRGVIIGTIRFGMHKGFSYRMTHSSYVWDVRKWTLDVDVHVVVIDIQIQK